MFALDNIWDGLGAICVTYDHIDYFYGKVTMYPTYNREARNLLLNFLNYYFPDHNGLMHPTVAADVPVLDKLDQWFETDPQNFGAAFKKGQRTLNKMLAEHGESIPPLIKQYMGLSPEMVTFGTFINKDFGNVEETGILIPIPSIYDEKKTRYLTF
jgi:hypothetical protein